MKITALRSYALDVPTKLDITLPDAPGLGYNLNLDELPKFEI